MKIITGGAGFIGSALCWRLNLLGFNDILIVDSDLEGTKKKNLEYVKYSDFIDKNTFIKEITNKGIYDNVETLYHMGACTSTTEENMDYLKKNNFEYSVSLARWALENNVRFIYASSGATYGNGSRGFNDEHSLIPELEPLNKYGLSKQMFDMWVLENKLVDKVVGLKYFNVFGPNENHKRDMRSMVNKAYSQILNSNKMNLFKSYKDEYENGEQKRDFVYVKDAVDMTVFFDASNKIGNNKYGIFNVGSGKAHTWNELAYAIFKAMNIEPQIEYVEMPDNIRNQYQYFSQANISKLRTAGYKNDIMNLEESVKDYIVNYLSKDKYLSVK